MGEGEQPAPGRTEGEKNWILKGPFLSRSRRSSVVNPGGTRGAATRESQTADGSWYRGARAGTSLSGSGVHARPCGGHWVECSRRGLV